MPHPDFRSTGAYPEKILAHLERDNVRWRFPSGFLGKKQGLVAHGRSDQQRLDDCNDDAGCNHDLCSYQVDHDGAGAHGIECSFHDQHGYLRASQPSPFLRERRKLKAVSGKMPCLSVIQLCGLGKEFFIPMNLFYGGAWPETGTGYSKDGDCDGHWHACHLWMCGIFVYMCGGN